MKDLQTVKILDLKRLMMAVAMTAFIANHAFAATLKAESTIMHDKIVLGDVFDGVTENADYYLAPAPAMGKTVTLNAEDLARISEAFHLGWTADNTLQRAVIRRASSEIDRIDIQAAVQEKLSESLKGRKFSMELSDPAIGFRIPEAVDKSLNVSGLTYDAAKGTFKATVSVTARPDLRKEVKGRFYQISQLPVLKSPMRPGDVISASDIDYIEMRAPDISSTMVTDENRLIGQTPRHGVAALKPLTASDIQMPLVVKKGETVTMTLKSGALNLTAQGRAMDSGAEGDTIHIMNTSSKQTVEAVVTGPQTVNIKPPSNILSMNTL